MLRYAAIALTLISACAPVRSVAVPTGDVRHTPYRGHVTVSATRDPVGGTEIGAVEATGGATIEDVIPELVARVAQLGGNYARIDHIATRYQWVSQPVMQSYQCGTFRFPSYCQRTVMQTQEIATLRATGRAFRVGLP